MSSLNQFVTVCRTCGRPIVMTCSNEGRWIPCNGQIVRFKPCGGPETFVTEDGKFVRGKRDYSGTELGYMKHGDCVRNRVAATVR